MALLGNLGGLMTLSAKTSENYFLIGPSADTECKLHIPHEGDKIQGDHKKVKGWCLKSFFNVNLISFFTQFDEMNM